MLPVYIGSLLFGGILIGASAFSSGDHDHGAHTGGGYDADHGDGHGHADHQRPAFWLPIIGLRFWSFALAFFGLTGVVLSFTAAPLLLVPIAAGAAGVSAGLGASKLMRLLAGKSVGVLPPGGSFVGREGRLLLPVDRAQRGKLRVSIGGITTDLVAETESDAALAPGSTVLIVGMRGNVALIERNPAVLPGAEDVIVRKETP